jgi:hypothetical protein
MGDAAFHLGTVALVNSLRLVGHSEPITVLDLGFTPSQRESLAHEVDFVTVPGQADLPAYLLKAYPVKLGHQGPMVLIDSDIIVTRRLDSVMAAMSDGQVVVFPDDLVDRRRAEWRDVFELGCSPRHQAYANSGFVGFSTYDFPDLLARWWDANLAVASLPREVAHRVARFPDQDALNALLMTTIDRDAIAFLPRHLAPMGPGQLSATSVVDVGALRCKFEGQEPVLLHATKSPKPWSPGAPLRLPRTAFESCLRRLLTGRELAVRPPVADVPFWLRAAPASIVARHALHALGLPTRTARRARTWISRRADRRGTAA